MALGLKGLAASPGEYVGRAFIATQPNDLSSESIEVLVIKAAGVEWLEAIINAKAVVTEVGGMMSHAASICRELGKPCVTAVADVTLKLRPDTLVSVNGTTGEVTIVG